MRRLACFLGSVALDWMRRSAVDLRGGRLAWEVCAVPVGAACWLATYGKMMW